MEKHGQRNAPQSNSTFSMPPNFAAKIEDRLNELVPKNKFKNAVEIIITECTNTNYNNLKS